MTTTPPLPGSEFSRRKIHRRPQGPPQPPSLTAVIVADAVPGLLIMGLTIWPVLHLHLEAVGLFLVGLFLLIVAFYLFSGTKTAIVTAFVVNFLLVLVLPYLICFQMYTTNFDQDIFVIMSFEILMVVAIPLVCVRLLQRIKFDKKAAHLRALRAGPVVPEEDLGVDDGWDQQPPP